MASAWTYRYCYRNMQCCRGVVATVTSEEHQCDDGAAGRPRCPRLLAVACRRPMITILQPPCAAETISPRTPPHSYRLTRAVLQSNSDYGTSCGGPAVDKFTRTHATNIALNVHVYRADLYVLIPCAVCSMIDFVFWFAKND